MPRIDHTQSDRKMTAYHRRCGAAEAKVLEQIKRYGGFSVFWATENMDRARAIDRLHRKKRLIAPKKGKAYGRFPWCNYALTTTKADIRIK